MMPEIDALTAYAATAINAPLDVETPSPDVKVRQLAIRALADANEHRMEAEIAKAKCEAALEKHHELIALAAHMRPDDAMVITGNSLATMTEQAVHTFAAIARENVIRPIE